MHCIDVSKGGGFFGVLDRWEEAHRHPQNLPLFRSFSQLIVATVASWSETYLNLQEMRASPSALPSGNLPRCEVLLPRCGHVVGASEYGSGAVNDDFVRGCASNVKSSTMIPNW